MAAFQQLGPFISTFADSDLTGLFVNEEGVLIVKNQNNFSLKVETDIIISTSASPTGLGVMLM
jgi:hypothetical protein